MTDSTKEQLRNFADVIRAYNGRNLTAPATDDDVKAFIKLFMNRRLRGKYNHHHSSYGLKHIAERVIGHLFYNSKSYAYVSNDQFKRCMKELGFAAQLTDKNSPNERYRFSWVSELKPFIEAFNNV